MHPTQNKFVYDRSKVPVFFSEPAQTDLDYLTTLYKEYYRKTRELNLCEHVPLANGMTTGEFAMHTITMRHKNRKKKY